MTDIESMLISYVLSDCNSNGGHFFRQNGKCYILSSDKASWNQGRLNCQKRPNGEMASINNEETMNFIKKNIHFSESTWFGAKKKSGGNWEWVDDLVLYILGFWRSR